MSQANTTGASTSFQAAAIDRVEGLYANPKNEWGEAIGLPPDRFMKLWTEGLPGKPNLSVTFTGAGQGDWNLNSPEISADGNFSKAHGTLFLHEVRIEEDGQRRHGTGKRFFANLVAACREWGIKEITLSGGREDGAYFWSRRGAYLRSYSIDRFKTDIREVLQKLGDDVTPETRRRVNDILDTSGPEVSARLARLDDQVRGQPVGLVLLRPLEPRMIFSLDNPEQMKLVTEGLKTGSGGTSPPAPIMV